MNLWGLWIYQVPQHHDFSTVDWRAIDIDQPFYEDALDWSKLLVKDIENEEIVQFKPESAQGLPDILPAEFGAPSTAVIRTYAFGICTALIGFPSTRSLPSVELAQFGRLLDESSPKIVKWLVSHGHGGPDNDLTELWNSCVISMQSKPDSASDVATEIRGLTETVALHEMAGVSQSLVGNKFSLFHGDSLDVIHRCLELYMRAQAYAAGMYRYERLMIRELVRLASGVRMRRTLLRESSQAHNGARLLRALWTHQFIAGPVNERQIQEGLWNLWDMKELTESVVETSDKVSSLLSARRDQRRNELASRLNWILLIAALLQVIIAIVK